MFLLLGEKAGEARKEQGDECRGRGERCWAAAGIAECLTVTRTDRPKLARRCSTLKWSFRRETVLALL